MKVPAQILALLAAPPPSSKVALAQRYGLDLSTTARNMFELTPKERLVRLEHGADNLKFLRRRG